MNRKKTSKADIILYIFFILLCACFVVPVLLVVSASLSSEASITSGGGFSLLPKEFTFDAYVSSFSQGNRIITAYGITIAQAVLSTVLSCLCAGLAAYSLSRTNFRFKGFLTAFIFFTMLFGAGMIPSYIMLSKYYGLKDNFLIYILPGMAGGAWNTMIFRTFFKGLPETLFESAKIDGAKELTIFFKLVLPLSTPVFASLGFMYLVGKWNYYTTSMIYITDANLYTLQYLLQKMMSEAEFLAMLVQEGIVSDTLLATNVPNETLKYAMCVISAGPMMFIFPFFQKYFSRGLTIGAVKG